MWEREVRKVFPIIQYQRTYYALKTVYVTKAYEATNTGQVYILGT